ncbi:MAG TPA: Gmad2 immunoglobulin-like domain-containing protein [Acidimicrobiales bacterium]|nr:Gmad2 immunoglobulin-like domain-containing protein [Acidimicrobiales bacterium]
MSAEDRLRTALHAAADDTPVDPGSFDRIERRTVAARRRRRGVGGGLAAVALVAVAVTVPLALRDDGGEPVQTGPASDTRDTTTTTTTTPTTTTEPDGTGDPPAAEAPAFQWPVEGDARTFDEPVALVQAFATEYLGVVGPGITDNGDDTATVRPRREDGSTPPSDGPRTVVEWATVDDHLVVVGAYSPNIRVDTPERAQELTSPARVSGHARNLYEANVIVEVRFGGLSLPIATVPTAAGGSGPDLAPFSVDVPFEVPVAGRGAIVVHSDSGVEGTPEATVVPVRFGSQPAGETIEVTVFLQDAAGDFVPVTRTVPRTSGVLKASIEQQLLGADAREQARGLTSPFSDDGDQLRGVNITEPGTPASTAVIDFEPGIVDALAGADGAAVLASLDRTVFQFAVGWVRYSVGGECRSFAGIDTDLLCERRSRDEY